MNEIYLEQLRDIAIEYLPAAQKARDNFKQWGKVRNLSGRDYAYKLSEAALLTLDDATLPAIERAAAKLLEIVSLWQTYDPSKHNSPDKMDANDYIYEISEAAKTFAAITNRDIAHLLPAVAPAAKVEATTTDDDTKILAALFDPVPVEALEKMFPAKGKWKSWADKAKANGLIAARVKTAMFNPYKAGEWFVLKGAEGWDIARLNRTLANNLPTRSLDDKCLLTGGID